MTAIQMEHMGKQNENISQKMSQIKMKKFSTAAKSKTLPLRKEAVKKKSN